MNCLLCQSPHLDLFSRHNSGVPWHLYSCQVVPPKTLDFFRCVECRLVTKDPAVRCDSQQERKHYEKHNNNLEDSGYRQHLFRLVNPIVELVQDNSRGLDYGCGPTVSIGQLFKERGMICDSYDPIFFPQADLLKKESYDFITCCEVVEHFKSPRDEFESLISMLKPGGRLIISTHTVPDRFEDWWYQRDPTHIVFYSTETFSWIAKKYRISFRELGDNLFLFFK